MYLVHSFVLDLSPLNHLWRDTSITALPEVLFIPIIFSLLRLLAFSHYNCMFCNLVATVWFK